MNKRLLIILTVAIVAFALSACGGEPPMEKRIAGEITDGTTNAVTIRTDDERALTFATEGADTAGLSEGLIIGRRISITYTGEIEESDASGVKVVRIEDA